MEPADNQVSIGSLHDAGTMIVPCFQRENKFGLVLSGALRKQACHGDQAESPRECEQLDEFQHRIYFRGSG
jgi:hypothetical protein